MKISDLTLQNKIVENEEASGEVSLKDVIYDPDDSNKKLVVMSNFKSVAPNGKPMMIWEKDLTLEDLPITSLSGFPRHVIGGVKLSRLSNLKSLIGFEHTIVDERIELNGLNLEDLEGIGKSRSVDLTYTILDNCSGMQPETIRVMIGHSHIKSFKGISPNLVRMKIYGNLSSRSSSFDGYSFDKIHTHIHSLGTLILDNVPIKEDTGMLGFLKIKGLDHIEFETDRDGAVYEALKIINKYLPEGDIMACQNELIDAGFEANAKL